MFLHACLAKQPNTLKQYAPVGRKWQDFCAMRGFDPNKSDPKTAALFLSTQLSDAQVRKVGPGVIEQCSAGLTHYFTSRAMSSPCTNDPFCSLLRKAAHNMLTGSKLQRDAATTDDVLAVVQHFLTTSCSLQDRMLVTAMVIQFLGDLRFEQLASIMVHEQYLRVSDERVDYYIWHDKTDPSSTGQWRFLPATGRAGCPVRLTRELLAAGGYRRRPRLVWVREADSLVQREEDVGYLLRAVTADGSSLLMHSAAPGGFPRFNLDVYNAHIRRMTAAAGVGNMHITSHSFRIGGASAAANAGIGQDLIQSWGGWKSSVTVHKHYVRYVTPTLAAVPLAAAQGKL